MNNDFINHLLKEFHLPLHNPILVFSTILLIILLSPVLLRKLKIPGIIGLIVSGTIIGPHGFNVLEKTSAIELFSTIGLLYIMFMAGLELDLRQFKRYFRKSVGFGFLTFIIPLALGYPLCTEVLHLSPLAALLTASMFSTHTLVAYPIISKFGLTKHRSVAITVGGTILTDTAVLIILAIISLILLFAFDSKKPFYTVMYFLVFFIICLTLYGLSKLIIFYLRKRNLIKFLPLRLAVKNITNPKTIFPITVLSLGLGVTLLLSLTLIGYNFKKEVQKSIPEIAPDYFFVSIQNTEKDEFVKYLKNNDKNSVIETMPIVSATLIKINKKDPLTYIKQNNDSFWVLERDRRISWSKTAPKDNPIIEGNWFDENSKSLQISLDAKVAKDLNIKINDSLFSNYVFTDTVFNLNKTDVLKKFKGYYFLNKSIEKTGFYEVEKLNLTKGVLNINGIETENEISLLENITESKKRWKIGLLSFAAVIGLSSLVYTNILVKKLQNQEKEKIEPA